MDKATGNFLEYLKQRTDVLGVIMFGSYARGNERPDSDVDLLIILTEGYRRTVEHREGQAFEIIYTTAKGALGYWKNHLDDAAGLWAVAKVLYDKDGTIEHMENKIRKVLDKGKKSIEEHQLGQFRFDAEDTLSYVGNILDADPISANLILANKIFILTELFFDIRQLWIPAPKQRMAEIKGISPDFYAALAEFYSDKNLKERLAAAKSILPLVFPGNV
jgi:predicted nucleotidyltransferase